MIQRYITIAVFVLAVLTGLGAFWQHRQYIALSQRFESIVEANKALAEASKRQDETLQLSQATMSEQLQAVLQTSKQTQAGQDRIKNSTKQGTQDEKAIMSASLPAAVSSVLDAAYQNNNEVGIDP
jgi:hypothetical protein